MNMEWWVWLLLGLFLFLGELVTPGGFYIIFFGVGAIVVGILAGFGLAGPLWFQWILFTAISLVALWLFRDRLVEMTQAPPRGDVDSLIGETAIVLEEIPAGAIGKAEMRGAAWSARNIGGRPLARGERCKVERVEGLTLWVSAA
ncbi:MAG TPA: NfeD family protein [Candidatus Acidoferrales bacterium]|nr:NfeD family protein [Candidatus Acidoferrales bacterium]